MLVSCNNGCYGWDDEVPKNVELQAEDDPVSIDIWLNDDTKYEIVHRSDIPERNKWMRVSKNWNVIANNRDVWERTVDELKISFYKNIKENEKNRDSGAKDRFNRMVIKIDFSKIWSTQNTPNQKEDIKECMNTLKNTSLTSTGVEYGNGWLVSAKFRFNSFLQNDLDQLRKSVRLKDIKTLQQFGKALDALLIWSALSDQVPDDKFNLDFKAYLSVTEVIEVAANLNEWCEKHVFDLQAITNLDLKNFEKLNGICLGSLPAEIWFFLPNLTHLNLANKMLTSLPDEMGQCSKLINLDLSWNRLMSLPESFSKLQDLQVLNVNYNWLKEFPACILGMKKLEILEINSNKLASLPENISELKNLATFNLSWNKIDSIDSLSQLENLQHLDASYNYISSLPENISELTNLATCHLKYNRIRSLPAGILELGNLQQLDLKDNGYGYLWISVPDGFWTSNLANFTKGVRSYREIGNNWNDQGIGTVVSRIARRVSICTGMGIAAVVFNIDRDPINAPGCFVLGFMSGSLV